MYSNGLEEQIVALEQLFKALRNAESVEDQLLILDKEKLVQKYLESHPSPFLKLFSKDQELAFKSVLAVGQGEIVFKGTSHVDTVSDHFKKLLSTLIEINQFYSTIGGIIGYHLNVLKLIFNRNRPSTSEESVKYQHPPGINIAEDTLDVRKSIRFGIESLNKIAVMYPVGGAGDRLNLKDEKTGEALPAAVLPFCGRSLLEGLIRDLQAREYLYFKIHGRQLQTPVAMMTSHEKNNHHYILSICEENNWFGRNKEDFLFFIQPLVPMIAENGTWVMQGDLQILLKPGGHGVIWKLASDKGILDHLIQKNYTKVLVRQINNPIAGIDHGLCAFLGWGYQYDKDFGFASCPRLLNTSEGMDVLVEKPIVDGYEYYISNIEYTEFEKYGMQDVSANPGSPFSLYPANTNILFADLETIKETVSYCPLPGMLINMKSSFPVIDEAGNEEKLHAGRLESTMQNVSDYIVDHYPDQQKQINPKDLKSFITYNDRRKTISVSKNSYLPGRSFLETPESCFYELMQNHEELLKTSCCFSVPESIDVKQYLEKGPTFIFIFHPALGPLYQIIKQKLRHGFIAKGSELQLEISEVSIDNLNLDGTLLIEAENVLGHLDNAKKVQFSHQSGKCELRNVTVKNQGIDRQAKNVFWKNQIHRKESLHVILKGNAEFVAEDVIFEGNYKIEVPSGHFMRAEMKDGKIHFKLEKIAKPTWYWSYSFDSEEKIQLKICKN